MNELKSATPLHAHIVAAVFDADGFPTLIRFTCTRVPKSIRRTVTSRLAGSTYKATIWCIHIVDPDFLTNDSQLGRLWAAANDLAPMTKMSCPHCQNHAVHNAVANGTPAQQHDFWRLRAEHAIETERFRTQAEQTALREQLAQLQRSKSAADALVALYRHNWESERHVSEQVIQLRKLAEAEVATLRVWLATARAERDQLAERVNLEATQ